MSSDQIIPDAFDDLSPQEVRVPSTGQAACPACGQIGQAALVSPLGATGEVPSHRLRRPWLHGEPWDAEPAAIIDELRRVLFALERDLVGFRPLLIQSLYALLTRENLLIFSPAGTAKTFFAASIFGRIRGARVFDTQMSKGTLAEELFGSIDTGQLKRGRIVHNTRGTLVDADLAFIDEFFDANDMVLRALLGVFNERVFKKGSQLEHCPLHTGIAAANYLRATEVTEAVLDRFLFRAYITPDYSALTLLGIDQAFGRHYGRHEAPAEDEQIPLQHIAFLADIVRGLVPERRIEAPASVLFLKNMVLNRYRELIGQACEAAKKRALYISPRTYAKARIVLNAAALIRGRSQVTSDDLAQLRYAVTTVGGWEEQAACFDKALNETLVRIRPADLEHIDQLVAARDLADHVMARVKNGEPIPCTSFVQRILRFFGLLSAGDVTFDHVRRFVDGIKPQDEQVKTLKLEVLRWIQDLARRVDRMAHEPLA